VAAPVVRGVDGDTFLVHLDGKDQYVRMIGIDTPETVKPGTPVQCYGERASHYTTGRVTGRTAHLVFDAERHDVYGRLLAYVYLGHDLLNADLVRRGFARTLTIAPNTAHESLFARLAQKAGRAGRGLWGSC
jgi:micrococcal nuclease